MKRKLNESYAFPVKIDVVQLVHDYPELEGNMDDLATKIEDSNADATVSKEEDGDTVYMVIDGLTQDDIIDIFEDDYNIDDIDNYFTYDDADDELDDVESDDDARNAAEADMQDEYGDDYQDMTEDYGLDDEGEWLDIPEDDDARDTAIDDMKDEYGDDYIDMDESIDDDEYLDDDDDYDDMIPDYDEVDPDDPDALDARDSAYADMEDAGELDDDDDLYDETYEDADEEFAGDDALNDSDDDEFDECMEDQEFECYESKNDRRLRRKKLLEKKKGCCPGKKRHGKRLVNLSEALKMRKNGLTTKDIVRSAKKVTLNESIINRAINKAKKEPVNKNAKLQQKRRELLALKESIGAEKFEFIRKAMKSGKKNLYEKKTINGKNITEYTAKELLELLNTVKAQHTKLMKSYKSLNESASKSTKRELRDSILNKEKLMNILDEELTYRLTFKKLIKAKGLKLNEAEEDDNKTEDNPLEPLPVDPSGTDSSTDGDDTTDENPDNDEEVELSRVVITVANQDAADELKKSLVDAGVPDDAIEFEDEDDETDDSDKDDDSDSDTDDNADDSSTDDNTSNESLHYNKFKKLLEDDSDDSDDANANDNADDSSDANADADSDDNADGEDKPVKVVLTNTDYVNDLADVLNNEYGITKEEFEDMIGGQIVDDDSDSTDDSDSSDDNDSDSGDSDKDDDKKDDEPSSNGDDAVDSMSQEELDKLFGGN